MSSVRTGSLRRNACRTSFCSSASTRFSLRAQATMNGVSAASRWPNGESSSASSTTGASGDAWNTARSSPIVSDTVASAVSPASVSAATSAASRRSVVVGLG